MKNQKKRTGNQILLVIAALVCAVLLGGCSGKKNQTDENAAGQITTLAGLEGEKVGVITGSSYDIAAQEKLTGSQIMYYASYADMAIGLQQGMITAYVTDKPLAEYQMAANPALRYIDEVITEDQYGFVMKKGNTELGDQVNEALAELKADGTVAALEDKWIRMQDDDPTIERDASADTSRGTLRVITAADQEPFSFYKNGEIVGYDVELATRIAEKMGYDVEFTNAEFTSLFPAIQSDKYDMAIGCITITEERRESVLFSDSVYDGGTVAVLYDGTAVEEGSFLSDLKSSFQRTFITENRWQLIVNGLIVTVKISVAALIAGSILGFFYSMVLRSRNRLIRGAGNALSTLLDGMPLLITLMIFYYIIFNKTSLSAMVIAVLAFSLDFANVVAGLLNTGISAVDPGQLEAAEAMGYPKWQIFTKITFPQAAKQMAGQFNGAVIGLIKGTSVVGYITIQDLTKAGDLIRSRTYEAFFPLIVVAVIYFLIAHIFIAIIKQFEKKLDPKRRPRKVKGVITND